MSEPERQPRPPRSHEDYIKGMNDAYAASYNKLSAEFTPALAALRQQMRSESENIGRLQYELGKLNDNLVRVITEARIGNTKSVWSGALAGAFAGSLAGGVVALGSILFYLSHVAP